MYQGRYDVTCCWGRIGNADKMIVAYALVLVPTSPSTIHTCVRTHAHVPCAVHVHMHTIHLFSCTVPHAPVSHLAVVPLADGTYGITINRSQGLPHVSVVDTHVNACTLCMYDTYTHTVHYCALLLLSSVGQYPRLP